MFPVVENDYTIDSLSTPGLKPTGFLAASVEEYVAAISFILSHENELKVVSDYAREKSRVFSTERFIKLVKDQMKRLIQEVK